MAVQPGDQVKFYVVEDESHITTIDDAGIYFLKDVCQIKVGNSIVANASTAYRKLLLWDSGDSTTGADYDTDYILDDDIFDYDQLLVAVSTDADRASVDNQYTQQVFLDTKYLLGDESFHDALITSHGRRYLKVHFTHTSFRITQGGGDDDYRLTIYQIYGIRY